MRLRRSTLPIVAAAFFTTCLSCVSPAPVPVESALEKDARTLFIPAANLSFDRIEAESPERLSLCFILEAENPDNETALFVFSGEWMSFNDRAGIPAAGFTAPEGISASGGKTAFPLRLDINPKELLREKPIFPKEGSGKVEFGFDLTFNYGGEKTETVPVKAAVSFPPVLEPEFHIVSVVVQMADIIDTGFKVKMYIGNPNFFPVKLSDFSFGLYNGSRLWASGNRKNITVIPPEQSAEIDLLLTMNFIDMGRKLLDQVIGMEQIDYRFTGEATVDTGIEHLPCFHWKFDQSGRSPVVN
jgi:LEA14-like dessication related protein